MPQGTTGTFNCSLVHRPGEGVPSPERRKSLQLVAKVSHSVCDAIALPDYYPCVKNSITKSRGETELRDTQLIGENYACDVYNGGNDVIFGSPNQSGRNLYRRYLI